MDGIDIFGKHQWHPFARFGLTSPLFAVEADTVTYTLVALAIIVLLALLARISLYYPNSVPAYITKQYARAFMKLIEQYFNYFSFKYFAFIASLFTFLVVCNCLVIIPTMEEPTKDLNTTIALSLISFLYIQKESLQAHGIIPYLNEYFKTPLQITGVYAELTFFTIFAMIGRIFLNFIIAILLFPIELLGKAANILSLSFRLFGNIFGGSVIGLLWSHFKSGSILWQTFGFITGFNLLLLLFFGIFEGVIQALVFTILSVTYLSSAIRTHHE